MPNDSDKNHPRSVRTHLWPASLCSYVCHVANEASSSGVGTLLGTRAGVCIESESAEILIDHFNV